MLLQQLDAMDSFLEENGSRALLFFYQEGEAPSAEGIKFSARSDQGCHGTGKTGNLEVPFSRQGKHREFAKNIKNMFFTQGIYHQHREKFRVERKKYELVILNKKSSHLPLHKCY